MLKKIVPWLFLAALPQDNLRKYLSAFSRNLEAMINPDSILESRDITLPAKVCLVKAMVFPVVMYECESWTIMKAECQKIDAFELWYWRRLLGFPWTAWRSNQSILKEINLVYLLKGLMLKLKSNTLTT